MTERRYAADRIAVGCPQTDSTRKIVLLLDNETFEEVRAGAVRNNCNFAAKLLCNFAAQARMLIEVGLETPKTDAR